METTGQSFESSERETIVATQKTVMVISPPSKHRQDVFLITRKL